MDSLNRYRHSTRTVEIVCMPNYFALRCNFKQLKKS